MLRFSKSDMCVFVVLPMAFPTQDELIAAESRAASIGEQGQDQPLQAVVAQLVEDSSW